MTVNEYSDEYNNNEIDAAVSNIACNLNFFDDLFDALDPALSSLAVPPQVSNESDREDTLSTPTVTSEQTANNNAGESAQAQTLKTTVLSTTKTTSSETTKTTSPRTSKVMSRSNSSSSSSSSSSSGSSSSDSTVRSNNNNINNNVLDNDNVLENAERPRTSRVILLNNDTTSSPEKVVVKVEPVEDEDCIITASYNIECAHCVIKQLCKVCRNADI
jgi:hypothetical protein